MTFEKRAYWLWLHLVLAPCNDRFRQLIRSYNGVEDIYENRRNPELVEMLGEGEREKAASLTLARCRELLSEYEERGISFVPFADDGYPERLRETRFVPSGLFATGNLGCLKKLCVAGVGSRITTAYGRQAVKAVCSPLARAGITLVSGLAYGTDSEVHRAALDAGGVTAAVLGTAIDLTYPSRHRGLRREIEDRGAVVSEYAPETVTQRHMFPQRNRIVSGLSRAVMIFEAAARSGTMITANWALDDGREVFALPGSIFSEQSEGTNRLIKQGASLLSTAEDVLSALGVELSDAVQTVLEGAGAPVKKQPKLDARGQLVYDALAGGELTVDELLTRVALKPHELFAELTMLEVDGVIETCAGSKYRVV